MVFVQSITGDAEIINWMNNPENLVYFAHELNYEGFELNMQDHRFPYLLQGGKKDSVIEIPVYRSGKYYLSFQFLAGKKAGQAPQNVAVELNGKPLGEFDLDADDGRYHLFCTEYPLDLRQGTIQMKVLSGENVSLTCAAFTQTPCFPKKNEVEKLTAMDGKIRFNTVQPSRCRVVYGTQVIEEDGFINCHAFDVMPVSGQREFIITAVEKNGKQVQKNGVVTVSQRTALLEETSFSRELFYEKRCEEKQPVCAFYGFSRGECFQVDNAGFADSDGRRYPCDCTVTSRWEDESVRTVSMTAVIVPDGRKYYFTSDAGICFDESFDIRVTGGELELINEGEKLRFGVDDKNLLPCLSSGTALYVEGERLVPVLGSWKVKRKGNAALILERGGSFGGAAKEQVLYLQLTFYRGIPGFRLEIGLDNRQTEPRLFGVDGWYLEFEKRKSSLVEEVFQIDDRWASVNGELVERRCEGEFELEEYRVYSADFWQNYPKSISCQDGAVTVGLLPFIRHEDVYNAYSEYDRRKLLYFMNGGKYWMHLGMRRILKFGFSRTPEKARGQTELVLLRPSVESLEKSEAFGKFLGCCTATEDFDEVIEQGYQFLVQMREEKREYGMFNYGDWHGENHDNWGNCEYDMPYAGLMQFLRGAEEKYAQWGLKAAEHLEQVDYIRVHANKSVEGLFWLHKPGHSNYFKWAQSPDMIEWWDNICAHRGHLFVQGLTEWYKVTGDERFRDAVLHCADTLCVDYCTCVDFDVERVPAWAMLAMLAAYELVPDRKYLNACRLIVERVCFKQNKRTGMIPSMLTRTETEGKMIFTGKPFMCGILMSALHRYYLYSGDCTAETVMDGIARWLVYEMWDEEAGGFWYTGYSKSRNAHTYPSTSMEILEGLLYVYEKNGDPLIYETAIKAMKRTCSLEYRDFDVGKNLAMRMRFAPVILQLLYGKKSES